MKRVFAHLGFSAAVMLLILNFFSVTFAYIALGVVLAALCLVLSVPRLRQGVSVWLCLVGAVVACVTFIVGVHAAYLPQQKLVGQTAQVQFYVTDVRRGAEKNDYTVKTTAIDLPGVPPEYTLHGFCPCGSWRCAGRYLYRQGDFCLYR